MDSYTAPCFLCRAGELDMEGEVCDMCDGTHRMTIIRNQCTYAGSTRYVKFIKSAEDGGVTMAIAQDWEQLAGYEACYDDCWPLPDDGAFLED